MVPLLGCYPVNVKNASVFSCYYPVHVNVNVNNGSVFSCCPVNVNVENGSAMNLFYEEREVAKRL